MFTKRQVCLNCECDLPLNERYCQKCGPDKMKQLANIYDADLSLLFTRTLDCLSTEIDTYRTQFLASPRDESTNDIPYNNNYQLLLNTTTQLFISIILHLEGIGLSRSHNHPLWLLSCSLVELPPHLRIRRFNMPVLSAWIAEEEPNMKLWLGEIVRRLQTLKNQGENFLEKIF